MKQQMNLLSKFGRGYRNRLSTFSRIRDSIRSNGHDSVNIVFRTWSHLISLPRNDSTSLSPSLPPFTVFLFSFLLCFYLYLYFCFLFFFPPICRIIISCYCTVFGVLFIRASNNISFFINKLTDFIYCYNDSIIFFSNLCSLAISKLEWFAMF